MESYEPAIFQGVSPGCILTYDATMPYIRNDVDVIENGEISITNWAGEGGRISIGMSVLVIARQKNFAFIISETRVGWLVY